MTSPTPIYEQLCRDFLGTGNSWSVESEQPTIISQPKGPAHSLERNRNGLDYEGASHLTPRAEWACPTG